MSDIRVSLKVDIKSASFGTKMPVQMFVFIISKNHAVVLWRCIFYTKYPNIKQIFQKLREFIRFKAKLHWRPSWISAILTFWPNFPKSPFFYLLGTPFHISSLLKERLTVQAWFLSKAPQDHFLSIWMGCLALNGKIDEAKKM